MQIHQETSDHTPLLASLTTNIPKSSFFFCFENAWLLNHNFLLDALLAWHGAHPRANDGIFLFLILFKQYFNTNPIFFFNLTLLITPARLARLYHAVASYDKPSHRGIHV
jgi:hypothetical protein